jgi:polyhydroxyalkanoate synthesis regulator protein
VVPEFLAASFEMLREGQSKMMENLAAMGNPMASMPGFEAMQAQQQAFMKAMMGRWGGSEAEESDEAEPSGKSGKKSDLEAIRKQLAELQSKLSDLG